MNTVFKITVTPQHFCILYDSVLFAGAADQYVNTNNGLNIFGKFYFEKQCSYTDLILFKLTRDPTHSLVDD